MLVGVSHRLTQSIKVYVNREGETSELKKWNVNGVGVILGSCGFHQRPQLRRIRRIYVMMNVADVAIDVLSRGLGAD